MKAQDNVVSDRAVQGQPAAGFGEEFITWQQTVNSPALTYPKRLREDFRCGPSFVIMPLRGSLNIGHEHHCLPQFYQLRAVQTRVMFSMFGSGSVWPCQIFWIWLTAMRFEPNFESTAEGSNGSHGAAFGSVGVYLWLLMGRKVGGTWQGVMSGVWEHQRQCWDIMDGRRS